MRKVSFRFCPSYKQVMQFWEWLVKKYMLKEIKWHYFIWFTLVIHYGRRLTELMLLRTEDFDFEKDIIWFRQLKTRQRDPDERPKHMIKKIKPFLEKYVNFCKSVGQEELFECTSRNMRHICYKYTEQFFDRKLFPHVFRYVLNTYLNTKCNIEIVREFFGHKNIRTTQMYTRLSTEDVRSRMPVDLQ